MEFLFPDELSVRDDASGGGVSKTVQQGPGMGPQGRSRVILLIHGYDNSLESARSAYGVFRQNFATSWPEAVSLLEDMFEFYWPGDKAWPPLLHYLSYPMEIRPARKSGEVLADFLRSLRGPGPQPVNVFLIAHSLGNRVVQEMLRKVLKLSSGGQMPMQVQIQGVCMMAAAVPISKVEPGGKLHAASVSVPSHVLYSPDDSVLHYAFAPGETLAFDAFWPTAIGHEGQPKEQWTLSQLMRNYGHSDYWVRNTTTLPVARFLGLAVPRTIAAAPLPSHTLPAVALRPAGIASHRLSARPLRFG